MSTITAVCLLVALAASCGASDNGRPALSPTATNRTAAIVIPAGQPVVIGVSTALSGEQVDLGTDLAAAAEFAVGEYGGSLKGHPIEVARRDDGCTDPRKAVDVAALMIAVGALAGVIGPMCTTGAQAANVRYEAAGIVHISPSATRDDLSEQGERYFFRTAWRDDAQARVQATYTIDELDAATAIVIDDGEPYGDTLSDGFVAAFEDRGGRVLSRERIARGTTDLASLARRVKDAGPDVVVFEGLNPEGALLVKALGEAEFNGNFIGPDGLLSARDFLPTAGSAAEGAIITGGRTPDAPFVEKYVALYQRPPTTPFVLQAHDAVTALLKAIEMAAAPSAGGGLSIDRAKLADTLRRQRFAGLTGSVTFDEKGDRSGQTPGELGLTVYRVENGAFTPVP
jgi:branched-chain amino acid transport system substrate-binding protein